MLNIILGILIIDDKIKFVLSFNKERSLLVAWQQIFRYCVLFAIFCVMSVFFNTIFAATNFRSSGLRWHREIKGPRYQTPNVDLYFGGFLQADFMSLYGAAPQLQGISNWRDGRVSMGFNFYKVWQFDATYDFKQHQLLDAYFAYVATHVSVMVGQVFPVFGIANTADTSQITFLELPLPVIPFSTVYNPGVEIGLFKNPFTLYASIFGPQLGTTVHGRNPLGATISATFAPLHTDKKVFVLSLSGWQESVDSFHTLEFDSPPEVVADNGGTLIGGENIGNVKNFQSLDGGAAGVYGPFSLQGEWIYTWVNRTNNFPMLQLRGFYITASYFLTGESRIYSFRDAGFVGMSPVTGKYGAWQIAVRYSQLNLMSQNVAGGNERDITLGLNWFPFQLFAFKFNYVHAMARPNSAGKNQTANMYVLRLQVVF